MNNEKILIVAEVFSENLGDGIIYMALSDSLVRNFPNKEIEKLDLSGHMKWKDFSNESNEAIPQRSNVVNILKKSTLIKKIYYAYSWYIKNRKQCISFWEEKIQASDRVIIGGGQLFTDGNFSFPPKIFDIYRLCKKHKKPLTIFGCGVGKEWGYLANYFYRKVMKYANFISVRDIVSTQRVRKFANIESFHHADPGFSIARAVKIRTDITKGAESNYKQKLYINIQPLADFKFFVSELAEMTELEYIDFWADLVKECIERYQVSLITNGHIGDFDVINELYKRLQSDGINNVDIIPRAIRPEHLVEQISNCDAIISTRMHAGIVAYSLRKKVIPISWDDKVNNVWAEVVGNDQMVMSSTVLKTGIKLDVIESRFERSIENQDKIIDNAVNNIDRYIKIALTR